MAAIAQGSDVVYAAGAVQGIVLVTAPAASTVFTSPTGYHLSSARYAMFVPQVGHGDPGRAAGRIPGSALRSTKSVYLIGLGCGLVAMALLGVQPARHRSSRAWRTGCCSARPGLLGAGFGSAYRAGTEHHGRRVPPARAGHRRPLF